MVQKHPPRLKASFPPERRRAVQMSRVGDVPRVGWEMSRAWFQPVHPQVALAPAQVWPLLQAVGCWLWSPRTRTGAAPPAAARCSRRAMLEVSWGSSHGWNSNQQLHICMHVYVYIRTHIRTLFQLIAQGLKFTLHKHRFLLPPAICLFYL